MVVVNLVGFFTVLAMSLSREEKQSIARGMAQNEGWNAFRYGSSSKEDNPYSQTEEAHEWWLEGWNLADRTK